MSIQPTDPSVYLSGIDPRLVVTDMDGTLLDADSNIPERLWPLLREMKERGIVFAPASGRQYFTLASLFEREIEGMPIIAENGGFVVRDGKEISSITLDRDFVVSTVELLRTLIHAIGDDIVAISFADADFVHRRTQIFLQRLFYRLYLWRQGTLALRLGVIRRFSPHHIGSLSTRHDLILFNDPG